MLDLANITDERIGTFEVDGWENADSNLVLCKMHRLGIDGTEQNANV